MEVLRAEMGAGIKVISLFLEVSYSIDLHVFLMRFRMRIFDETQNDFPLPRLIIINPQ